MNQHDLHRLEYTSFSLIPDAVRSVPRHIYEVADITGPYIISGQFIIQEIWAAFRSQVESRVPLLLAWLSGI